MVLDPKHIINGLPVGSPLLIRSDAQVHNQILNRENDHTAPLERSNAQVWNRNTTAHIVRSNIQVNNQILNRENDPTAPLVRSNAQVWCRKKHLL